MWVVGERGCCSSLLVHADLGSLIKIQIGVQSFRVRPGVQPVSQAPSGEVTQGQLPDSERGEVGMSRGSLLPGAT